jgi:hypothetical protein
MARSMGLGMPAENGPIPSSTITSDLIDQGWHWCDHCEGVCRHDNSFRCLACGNHNATQEEAAKTFRERRDGLDYERAESEAAFERIAEANSRIPQAWEANRSGLSGRFIRGYRHWRYKR